MQLRSAKSVVVVAALAAIGLACSGEDGAVGVAGQDGNDGQDGRDGAPGDGSTGPAGEDGSRGPRGLPGAPGQPGDDGDDGLDGLDGFGGPVGLSLRLVGRYSTGLFDQAAAEIVNFHPASGRALLVNAQSKTVEVIDLRDPTAPEGEGQLPIAADLVTAGLVGEESEVGDANSVAVFGSLVAVAVAAEPKTDPGFAAFYSIDGSGSLDFLQAVHVGALPDMLTFTPDGALVLVANEGEPDDAYVVDPEGTISVIELPADPSTLSETDVTEIHFRDFDAGESRHDELSPLVRIYGVKQTEPPTPSSVAEDLEPEYIAVSPDGSRAFVSLQENNALAILDLATKTVSRIVPLGFKDHSLPGNELDVSDQDHGINVRSWPVFGMYQPDGIDAFEVGGATYVITANEGDSRDYPGFSEVRRIGHASIGLDLLNPTFGDAAFLKDTANLGRLNVSASIGYTGCSFTGGRPEEADGCLYERLYAYGARSFSIWKDSGELVFDSGNDFEVRTAKRFPDFFNSNHTEGNFEGRSDDKGPEPEGVEVARIAGRQFAFIGLERLGGVMVYDVTHPQAPTFVTYENTRDFHADPEADLEAAGDLGAEGLHFVPGEESPTGQPLLLVANEVSGTLAIFEVLVGAGL